MNKDRLRGFLKVHVFRKSFKMTEISNEGNLKVFKIGSVVAACSDDTEVSRKAILDYLMTNQEDTYVPFLFRNLTDEEKKISFNKRIFSIREGGAYFL